MGRGGLSLLGGCWETWCWWTRSVKMVMDGGGKPNFELKAGGIFMRIST